MPSAATSRSRGPRTSRSPTRPASGSSTPSAARSAAGRHLAARRDRRADPGSSCRAPRPCRPGTPRRGDALAMAGANGIDRLRAVSRAGVRALAGPLDARRRRSLHDERRLGRLRAGGLLLLLLPAGMAANGTLTLGEGVQGRGQRLVRSPVGRLRLGRRRRLGLVRDQPRRRDGHHDLGGPRPRGQPGPLVVRHAGAARRRGQHLDDGRVHGGFGGDVDKPAHGRGLSGRLADRRCPGRG